MKELSVESTKSAHLIYGSRIAIRARRCAGRDGGGCNADLIDFMVVPRHAMSLICEEKEIQFSICDVEPSECHQLDFAGKWLRIPTHCSALYIQIQSTTRNTKCHQGDHLLLICVCSVDFTLPFPSDDYLWLIYQQLRACIPLPRLLLHH